MLIFSKRTIAVVLLTALVAIMMGCHHSNQPTMRYEKGPGWDMTPDNQRNK